MGLIVINVAVFLAAEIGGDAFSFRIYGKFAMVYPGLPESGEWYRLVTACFLHFGIEHIGSNMLMLALLGSRMEEVLGRLRFIILYLLAGAGGTCASLFYHWKTLSPVMSAGASGALYGVVGALFAAILIRGRAVDGIGLRQIIIMIVFMIYSSTVSSNIDIAAHLGGLAVGFAAGLLLVKSLRIRYIERKNNGI